MSEVGTALITGGAKRIGRAIALTLADAGYDVAIHYGASKDAARELADEIAGRGRTGAVFEADLGDRQDVDGLVPRVFERFPDCSLLVNNASIFEPGTLLETDDDLFERHFAVNFRAPFFLSRDFARRCRRGQIVNLLDTKIARTVVNHFAYTLTKKALHEFTRMAAKELAPRIRVNGVCPGLILPPPGEDASYLDSMSKGIPLQAYGDPDAVAKAVLFLVTTPFVTGEVIFVDGGEHLK